MDIGVTVWRAMTSRPKQIELSIDFAPIRRSAEDSLGPIEPTVVPYQARTFVHRWTTDGSEPLNIDRLIADFVSEWSAFESELGSNFDGVAITQLAATAVSGRLIRVAGRPLTDHGPAAWFRRAIRIVLLISGRREHARAAR